MLISFPSRLYKFDYNVRNSQTIKMPANSLGNNAVLYPERSKNILNLPGKMFVNSCIGSTSKKVICFLRPTCGPGIRKYFNTFICITLGVLFVNIALLNEAAHAKKLLGLDASWKVNKYGKENTDGSNSYNQRYSILWNPEVTHALSWAANLNYSQNWTTGNGTREILAPSLHARLLNDLFQMEFNGNVNERTSENSRDTKDSTWEVMIGSTWQYLYWPSVRFIYGQGKSDDSGEIRRSIDDDREWYEFIGEWQMNNLDTYYSYYAQNRNDYVEGTLYEDGRHFARIDYGNRFFGNRGRFSISQQITDSVTDFTASDIQGGVNIAVNLSQGLSGIDPTPVRGVLPSNNGLIDGNRNNVAFVVQLQEVANLGIKADLQQVDKLYVSTGVQDPQFMNEAESLRWDLYTSNDGNEWQRVRVNPPTRYNRDEFRYEVDVAGTKSIFLKLVVTGWPVNFDVPITEIQAYRSSTGSDGSQVMEEQTYTQYMTDFNVSYSPTANTLAQYSFVWDNNENKPGNNRVRLFQVGRFQWIYNKYFVPALTVNESRTDNSEAEDDLARSYGLNVRSTPLPSLDFTFSLTRNESYKEGDLQNTNTTFNLLNSATIYPNLDSTLDINIVLAENEETQLGSNAYSARWLLTARLRKNLLVDFINEFGVNSVDFNEFTSEDDTGGRTAVNINYRPSDWLSFVCNVSTGYGETWSNYDSAHFNVNVSLLRTNKSQFSMGYRINANQDDTINNVNYNFGWKISEYLTFQSIGNYLIIDSGNQWNINARLTTRF